MFKIYKFEQIKILDFMNYYQKPIPGNNSDDEYRQYFTTSYLFEYFIKITWRINSWIGKFSPALSADRFRKNHLCTVEFER